MTRKIKTYSQLRNFSTFDERYEYLKLGGSVGHSTFGFDRYMNQKFYNSREWKQIREFVIVRDNGCDLGIDGREIHGNLLVHHINPITSDDLVHDSDFVLAPEYLITTTHNTHNAIHYGDRSLLTLEVRERTPGDTKLW